MLVLIIVFLYLHVQSHLTLVTFNGMLMSIALIAIITWSLLYSATAFALGFEECNHFVKRIHLLLLFGSLVKFFLTLFVLLCDQTPLIKFLQEDSKEELKEDVLPDDDQRDEVDERQDNCIFFFTLNPGVIEVNGRPAIVSQHNEY